MGQAPTDEEINLIAVMPHGIIGGISLGNNPANNEISEAPEIKVEVNIRKEALQETLNAIREVHPYEEPVINVIPLYT